MSNVHSDENPGGWLGDVIKYRCGFAAQKTRYEVWTQDEQLVERCDNAKDANALIAEAQADLYKTPTLEVEPVENALHSVKLMMQSIQEKYAGAEMLVYFSCRTEDNWRTKLYPQYKANRKPRIPEHATAIREYMDKKYDVRYAEEFEADDLIAMAAHSFRNQEEATVIATIDKDMDQIPGTHYNFVTQEEYEISHQDALYLLDLQIIAGDSVDNVPGIKGIGMGKARGLLDEHGDPAIVYDHAYESLEAGNYWFYLNKALVQLPWSAMERELLIQEAEDARQAFQAVQGTGPESDDGTASAGVGEAGLQRDQEKCS